MSVLLSFKSTLLCLILSFLFSYSTFSQCCTYTLSMEDSYGDGWNGGYLSLFINNIHAADVYGTGWGSSFSFSMCDGDTLTMSYTAQDYENENTYQLYDENWELKFSDGPVPKTGQVYKGGTSCSTTIIEGNNPCTAFLIDTTECAVAMNTLQTASGLNPYCSDFMENDVWFVMPVPSSGNLILSTEGGDLTDTGLAAWLGDNTCTGLRRIACDDDAGLDSYSHLTLNNMQPGQLLFIQVFGYGGATGQCLLCVEDPGEVKLDSSELPIITIQTNGQTIPNDPKVDVDMQMRYNGPGSITYIDDTPNEYDGIVGIEIRGASSAGYPQTPYGFETRSEDGEDKDVSLLGMPEEADWVLISNYNDRSLIRNLLAQKLFGDMGNYAPRMQLVEVVIDSSYKGVYVFGEKIKRDKGRVNIAKLDPEDEAADEITGGYILQQNLWDPATSFQSNYSPIDHPVLDIHFLYEYPKPEDISELQKSYIAAFVDTMETALYSDTYDNPETGYRKYLDTKSFIDYFLVNEVARNNDGFKKSVFFHKDRLDDGGKFKAGPVWDFDWAWKDMWGCFVFEATDGSGWAHHINDCPTDNYSCGYYIRLLQDSTFTEELKCTYEDYRSTMLDTAYIFNYIDSVGQAIENAQTRHFTKWPILGISGPAPEVGEIAKTYYAELDTLKAWIAERIEWLDLNMPGLCEVSTSTHETNANPFSLTCYPNPGDGDVFFKGFIPGKSKGWLTIFDSTGMVVKRESVAGGGFTTEITLDQPGIYFYTLSTKEGKQQSGKLIVNK